METLETERLRLRPFTLDDVDAYYAGISSDADVMRYLPGGQPRQRSDSQWVINYFMRHAELHGFGVWAVEEKASGLLIGHAGLEYIPGADRESKSPTRWRKPTGGVATRPKRRAPRLRLRLRIAQSRRDLRAGFPGEHGFAERHAQNRHGGAGHHQRAIMASNWPVIISLAKSISRLTRRMCDDQ